MSSSSSPCLPTTHPFWPPCNHRDGLEYVLPFVLERKTSQDLLASIKDGRYLQQKWRMLHSGIPHRLYLVETAGDGSLKDSHKRVSLFGEISGRLSSKIASSGAAGLCRQGMAA